MRTLFLTLALQMFASQALSAADWLSAHSRSQPDEKLLSAGTVSGLTLLWKKPFDEHITSPVVLGPIFTHRGIKELVFVAGAGDNLYAVDADLNRVVWKRHFEAAASCGKGLTAAPVLAPYYGPAPEGDDAATPRRSLFLLTSDGRLHTVRPADGRDLAAPVPFVPPGSDAGSLALHGAAISSYVSGGCQNPQPGEWTIQLTPPGAEPRIQPASPELPGPVLANGLSFAVSVSGLTAVEVSSGKKLFAGPAASPAPNTQLAVANGHVYFIGGQTLYCYGFPLEI